ncbi:flagellar biosynthetic protein FliQ [Endozoicomonas sp. GU-1]|uniref:flagellar biosynthetic protein FliQ n=1 Tax=Endozoicomonas sp. GU-1 TaxID=3009078 RepID=UPI0022B38377|nr:flagellar biosynthetic protein FliQ [Endozoicomonas sp. GU-1]WBA82547.1 flagellar biosynthetic protein FliQ [Endozoicomonas sp. GU-1]WBA85478.1 flagellar biosynthetic protein FliQ [Endozoicomonas sp. GU-1]
MTPEVVADLFKDALTLIVIMVSVIILPGMLVGLVISTIQAATQINEQTLSFLPRLLATLITIGLAGNWLIQESMDLFIRLYELVPELLA